MALRQVKVEEGWLEGLPAWNPNFTVFRGVPFAKPPVGDLRWKAPQPAEHWEGIRKAYFDGNIPMQPDGIASQTKAMPSYDEDRAAVPVKKMSEDCLYMNIWTPAEKTDEKLPVAIWIYGGAFITGSPAGFDGEGFAKNGIITVAISYRVNIFGFLGHAALSEEAEKEIGHRTSGNYGTLDQISAIKWVKRNIGAFGGNPEKITIFGQSAGSLSVQNIVSSDVTRGDICGAIMESGAGIGLPAKRRSITLEEAEHRGQEFLNYIDVPTIDEARKISGEKMLALWKEFVDTRFKLVYFSPVIDGWILKKDVIETAKAGECHDISYMIGCCAAEHPFDTPRMDAGYEDKKRDAKFCFQDKAQEYLDMMQATDHEEYWNRVLAEPDLYDACVGWCELQNSLNRRPAYQFWFSKKVPGQDKTYHCSELAYVFKTLARDWRPYKGEDYDMADMMNGYWSNFIKTGDPNGCNLPKWNPFTEEERGVLDISEETHMMKAEMTKLGRFQTDILLGKYMDQ